MPSIKGIPGPFRWFFYGFDCEEPTHIHVQREKLFCKFWLDPIPLAKNSGFTLKELNTIRRMVDSNRLKILEAWYEHCG